MSLEYLVEDKRSDYTAELTGWPKPLERLRQALQKNEFAVYCQPIVSLGHQAGAGSRFPMAEALVRMREEERALLPPGEFLPVFEHYGMMPELDRWVLRHAAMHLASGSRIPRFTINVSVQTLKDERFPADAEAELQSAKLPMDAILFEIDESDVLAHPEVAARFASAVRAYGGGVAIDGFGRRAVSFATFEELRPRFLKVDGSITRKLLVSEAAQTKMRTMVRLGEGLAIDVIAECVEDPILLTHLKALGVDYAQGFGIFRPQPIESLASFKF